MFDENGKPWPGIIPLYYSDLDNRIMVLAPVIGTEFYKSSYVKILPPKNGLQDFRLTWENISPATITISDVGFIYTASPVFKKITMHGDDSITFRPHFYPEIFKYSLDFEGNNFFIYPGSTSYPPRWLSSEQIRLITKSDTKNNVVAKLIDKLDTTKVISLKNLFCVDQKTASYLVEQIQMRDSNKENWTTITPISPKIHAYFQIKSC